MEYIFQALPLIILMGGLWVYISWRRARSAARPEVPGHKVTGRTIGLLIGGLIVGSLITVLFGIGKWFALLLVVFLMMWDRNDQLRKRERSQYPPPPP